MLDRVNPRYVNTTEVLVFDMVSDADQGGAPPVAPVIGNAYVVNNWGLGYTDDDIVVYDGATWNVAGDLTLVPLHVKVTSGVAAGSFTGLEKDILEYNAGLAVWVEIGPIYGMEILVSTNDSIYDGEIYKWDANFGWQYVFIGNPLYINDKGLEIFLYDDFMVDAPAYSFGSGAASNHLNPGARLLCESDFSQGIDINSSTTITVADTWTSVLSYDLHVDEKYIVGDFLVIVVGGVNNVSWRVTFTAVGDSATQTATVYDYSVEEIANPTGVVNRDIQVVSAGASGAAGAVLIQVKNTTGTGDKVAVYGRILEAIVPSA